MKKKEMIQLGVALVIFVVAGFLIYVQVAPKGGAKANAQATVTQVTPLNPNFDQNSLNSLTDSTKNRDFYNQPDLHSGLNNSQLFGPLQ